ncbi:MAG TPA: hypothetical protein VGM88_09170 [Kofleriaceae bacterium]|jgi:hypothetical protein
MIAPLVFPSSGLFFVSYPDPGCLSGHTTAICLPLDTFIALIATPKEKHGVRDLSRIPDSIPNASIGVANAGRVVVAPQMLAVANEAVLAERLTLCRSDNLHLMELLRGSRHLVAESGDVR